jgi:uracil-DNA glycosylase family 4
MSENITPPKISLWPEDKAPEGVNGCTRCELCKHKSRIIWGDGNPQAKVIIVLDNPGRREDKEGTPFVCGARETIQAAAFAAGFDQNDLYVTYILKCRPKRAYNKEVSRNICIEYLEQQLNAYNYIAAFCLGDVAVKSFFNDQERNVKNTRGSWNIVRGMPTYVSYHPLAVRRRPNLYANFIKDWEAVKSRVDSG